jgi:hypothetical protein
MYSNDLESLIDIENTMPQNQKPNKKSFIKSSSSLSSSKKSQTTDIPNLQYRRSRNDGGSSSGGDFSDENSDGSSIVSRSSANPKKQFKKAEEFDRVEYAKLLAELFPSKYSTTKAQTMQNMKTNTKYKQVVVSEEEETEESESGEEAENRVLRRSARLQKREQKQKEQEEVKPSKCASKAVKDAKQTKEELFYQSKKQKISHHEDDGCGGGHAQEKKKTASSTASTGVDKNGNYNIVINLQEPLDYLSDQYDDGESEMNDSVFDDESISSDQEGHSLSDDSDDETFNDDDSEGSYDSDDSRSSFDSDHHHPDDDGDDGEDDDEQVTTRGFQKSVTASSSSNAAAGASAKENINFTVNGKSIFDTENDKVKLKNKKHDKKGHEDEDEEFGSEDEATIQTIKAQMEALLEKDKNNKIARKTLDQMIEREERIKSLRKKKSVKQMRSNTRKFGRLLQKKNSANDLKYFKKYLTHEQQSEVLKELGELNKIMLVDKPYRLTLLESKIPQHYKAVALKRIQNLRYMDSCSGEYFKVKNWVDTFMTIPFGFYKTLPITMDVGVEQCHEFMETAKDILDSAVYGLNDAKMQIMQMVGQWISNPSALGSAIAIKGPPGTGKTTLVKEGISKILGRDFAFIALGGATDSSFLEGHSYTYEGSTWGKIVEILIRCKSMNPVIFFDELDKLSDTPKGEEIAGILTHLTDTSQNSQFHDKYFSEIAFDLSKCLFIFSYNDESKVNPILLDRMYRIHTNGYTKKDKTHIAQKYLIPKIQSEVAFKPEQIIIADETIEYIVEHYTNKEDGVRNLKRCLEIIFTKLNLYRLMKPGSKLFDKDSSSIEVTFPFTVTNSVVDKMVKKAETNSPPMFMYT